TLVGYNSIFSTDGRFICIIGYFEQITHGTNSASHIPITFEQFQWSILFPLLTAVVVLAVVFIYFTRKMEVD
ncbi:MAG: hypothetical protein LBE70_00795, partial [Nitrososphaerota archaeon]|nr:hypothetical protein [Nitrososphaerota archaeon]